MGDSETLLILKDIRLSTLDPRIQVVVDMAMDQLQVLLDSFGKVEWNFMSGEYMEWVTELKSQYVAEESIIFLLHGNIHDKPTSTKRVSDRVCVTF